MQCLSYLDDFNPARYTLPVKQKNLCI